MSEALPNGADRPAIVVVVVVVVAVVVVSALSLAAPAEDSDEVDLLFKSLYGKDIATAKQTSDKKDDIEVAAELLEIARSSTDDLQRHPKLMQRLLAAAVDLGSANPDGYATAIEATQLWEEHLPGQRLEATRQRVDLMHRVYRAAKGKERGSKGEPLVSEEMALARLYITSQDIINARKHARSAQSLALRIRSDQVKQVSALMADINQRAKIISQANAIRKQLKSDPNEAAARKLILIYLIDLDNPGEARKHLDLVDDEKLAEAIRLSEQPVDKLSEKDALTLGEFCFQLTKDSSRRNQVSLYERAVACFYQFELLNPDIKGLEGARIKTMVAAIEKWLDENTEADRALPSDLKKGLRFYLSFNSKSDVDRNKHIKVDGATWVRNGRGPGNSVFEFEGKGAKIHMKPQILGNWSTLTYAVWIRAPRYSGSSWPVFIGSYTTSHEYNNSIGFWQESGRLRMEVDTATGNFAEQGQHAIPVNKWVHVAMVYDGKSMREYVNGVPGASFPASGKLKSIKSLSLGQDHSTYESYRGHLDDAMIYSRALSAKEIRKLYDIQRGRSAAERYGKPVNRHLEIITQNMMGQSFTNAQDKAGVNGWATAAKLPSVLVNASETTHEIPGTALPGSVMTHPPSNGGAGIAWRSPVTGTFRVEGSLADAHDGGDSVEWKMHLLHVKGHTKLAEGSVPASGTDKFVSDASKETLSTIKVRTGDLIQLVVLPKESHSCDLTRIEWTITELGERGRVWNLPKDIVSDITENGEGNPHSDSHGNKDVWYFFEVPPGRVQELSQ